MVAVERARIVDEICILPTVDGIARIVGGIRILPIVDGIYDLADSGHVRNERG